MHSIKVQTSRFPAISTGTTRGIGVQLGQRILHEHQPPEFVVSHGQDLQKRALSIIAGGGHDGEGNFPGCPGQENDQLA